MKRNNVESQEGFALIFVLGFLFLVTLVVTPFTLQARLHAQAAANVYNIQKLELLAHGMGEVIADKILNRDWEKQLPFKLNGTVSSCNASNFGVQISVQDHRGLIDLNAGTDDILKLGFLALNLDPSMSENYARTVAYIRSIEHQNKPLGLLGFSKGRAFGRYSSVLELLDIESDNQLDHQQISNVFTVHTRISRPLTYALPDIISSTAERQNSSLQLGNQEPSYANGVYTLNITMQNKRSKLIGSVSKVVALGIYRGSPVQSLETIPTVISSNSLPETSTQCDELFGVEVADLLEKIK